MSSQPPYKMPERGFFPHNSVPVLRVGWLFAVLVVAYVSGIGQWRPVESSDTIVQTYSTKTDRILQIRNKYGEIHLNTWDKPEIRVAIEIVSRANQRDRAEKRLKEVEIRERVFNQKIQLETVFTSNNFLRLSREITDRGVNVNYEISMPANVAIEIENKFGNVYIADRTGNVEVTLNYGKLLAERLEGQGNVFDLSFGSADIAYIAGGDLKIDFSPLNIERGGDLNLTCNSAQVRMDQVDRLNVSASLGRLELGNVGEITGECSSGHFEVQRLGQKMDLIVRYATFFEVMEIVPGFESIQLDGKFSSFRLNFAPDAEFDLDAELQFGKMTSLSLGDNGVSEATSEDKIVSYTGRVGATRTNGGGKLMVRSKYGNLKLTK